MCVWVCVCIYILHYITYIYTYIHILYIYIYIYITFPYVLTPSILSVTLIVCHLVYVYLSACASLPLSMTFYLHSEIWLRQNKSFTFCDKCNTILSRTIEGDLGLCYWFWGVSVFLSVGEQVFALYCCNTAKSGETKNIYD